MPACVVLCAEAVWRCWCSCAVQNSQCACGSFLRAGNASFFLALSVSCTQCMQTTNSDKLSYPAILVGIRLKLNQELSQVELTYFSDRNLGKSLDSGMLVFRDSNYSAQKTHLKTRQGDVGPKCLISCVPLHLSFSLVYSCLINKNLVGS